MGGSRGCFLLLRFYEVEVIAVEGGGFGVYGLVVLVLFSFFTGFFVLGSLCDDRIGFVYTCAMSGDFCYLDKNDLYLY